MATDCLPHQVRSPCFESFCPTDWVSGTPGDECVSHIESYCSTAGNFHETYLDPACGLWTHLVRECAYTDLSQENVRAFQWAATHGRRGRGTVYVISAGNEYDFSYGMEDINYEAELFTRYTIAVGAVDKLGRHASYSTAGSELLISAPGGDTADFSHNHVVAQPGGQCQDVTVGTSFAAPVVSGVVALMLQARPTLTWRDVQGVLATTARLTDPTDSSWVTNGAQLKHSYRYGFGIVDAHAAVQSALTWTLLSPERRVTAKSTLNSTWNVPQDGSVLEMTLIISPPAPMAVEHVYVYLDLDHTFRGDLQLTLISPSGTPSILIPGPRAEATGGDSCPSARNTPVCSALNDPCLTKNDGVCDYVTCGCDYTDCGGATMPFDYGPTSWNWNMATVRSYNENAAGAWKLQIIDRRPANTQAIARVNSWSVFVYGHDTSNVSAGWDVITYGAVASVDAEPCYPSEGERGEGEREDAKHEDDGDPCFPSEALVTMADGTPRRLDELRAGDAIMVAARADGTLTTDTVSTLSLADEDVQGTTFVVLTTASGRNLTLTPTHHVPVGAACCTDLKQAKDVAVGDTMYEAVPASGLVRATKVAKISSAIKPGLHSPVLSHGTMPIVDGVATSFDALHNVRLASYGLPCMQVLTTVPFPSGAPRLLRAAAARGDRCYSHLPRCRPRRPSQVHCE